MGSVYSYENKSGRFYRIVYRRPDNTQTQERGFTRKRDAEQRLSEVEVAKHRDEYINPKDSKAKVADLGATWLKDRQHVMKPSAYRSLDSAWRTHVAPKWGDRALGSIRHSEVQSWVSALSKERSATTVLRAHGVLAAILDQAVKDRRLSRNVARELDLPRKGKSTRRVYLTHSQVVQLANESAHPSIVLLLAYTGLRWGEATALRVRDIDRTRRRLQVRENAVMVSGRIEVGTPKSHETRSVPYPEFLDEKIEEMSSSKSQSSLLLGHGLIHMRLPNSVRGWFTGAVERCMTADQDFPRVTPHDLRHTAASLAIGAGANVKAVQRMLGHASAAMTLDTYADLFDDDLDSVSEALDFAHRKTIVANMLPEEDLKEK